MSLSPQLPVARVVASHGRHLMVETTEGKLLRCHVRGKRNEAVVGDRVHYRLTGDEGVIESVLPRESLLYRQDELRTKMFAANIGQLLVLLAADPEFSEAQLARALIAAEAASIPVIIGLNKRDLAAAHERARARLAPYAAMGYRVVNCAIAHQPDDARAALLPLLQGRCTLVLGPSGTGKSSLINLLVPGAVAATNTVSRALNSGRHTTTSTTLYWLDDGHQTALIDSPGFQAFGLQHLRAVDLAHWMPDLRVHLGRCRFHNCSHRHEPDCGVRERLADAISPDRYRLYNELYDELSGQRAG